MENVLIKLYSNGTRLPYSKIGVISRHYKDKEVSFYFDGIDSISFMPSMIQIVHEVLDGRVHLLPGRYELDPVQLEFCKEVNIHLDSSPESVDVTIDPDGTFTGKIEGVVTAKKFNVHSYSSKV